MHFFFENMKLFLLYSIPNGQASNAHFTLWIKCKDNRGSLVVHQVKDLALSQQWLGCYCGTGSIPGPGMGKAKINVNLIEIYPDKTLYPFCMYIYSEVACITMGTWVTSLHCYTQSTNALQILFTLNNSLQKLSSYFSYNLYLHGKKILSENWNILDLQCCVSFRYKAKWFSFIYTYIYTYILFQILFH